MCAIFSSVACQALSYFFPNRENVIEHKMCVLKHISFEEEMNEIWPIYIGLHVKNPVFFSDFNES